MVADQSLYQRRYFYYVLYGMLGRAIIGMMDAKRGLNWLCGALFITGVAMISRGTLHELQWREAILPIRVSLLRARWSLSVAVSLLTLAKIP